MLDGSTYGQPADLTVDVAGSGWVRVHRAGAEEGVLLDPHVYRVWSAAPNGTLPDAASQAGVSTYLAACIVTLLARAGLLIQTEDSVDRRELPITHPPAHVTGTPVRAVILDASAPSAHGRPPIPAIVLHQHAEADLDACLRALSRQGEGVMGEIRVLAPVPVPEDVGRTTVIACDPDSSIAALREALEGTGGDAVLLLDSQLTLATEAVAGMAHALALRPDLAAVAPRVMWKAWPAIVVSAGDWRIKPDEVYLSPETGQIDVGQFTRRWQETPGVHLGAALIRTEVVRRVKLPDKARTLDWLGAAWSREARVAGYRTVADLDTLAFGPWPGRGSMTEQSHGSGWPDDWQRPLVEDGAPTLSVEHVRSVYCHYAGVAPGGVRPRVAIVSNDGSHARALMSAIASVCEVCRFEPREQNEALLRERLRGADVVVASEEAMAALDFLHEWQGAILLDAPPGSPGSETAAALLRRVDGAVCMGGAAAGAVRWRDRGDDVPDGEAWVMTTGDSRVARGMGGTRSGVMALVDFCHRPALAPGREIHACLGPNVVQPPPPPPTPARALPTKAWQTLRQRGARQTVREMGRYLRWKVRL